VRRLDEGGGETGDGENRGGVVREKLKVEYSELS
jgi:hypothetical protein